MKFIADVMLGKLAKRLRLLGIDVLYGRGLNDNDILRLSLEQDRIILTRDTALGDRPLAANHLLVESDLVHYQVEQVLSAFNLGHHLNPFSRCSMCNEPLYRITREDARDLVPLYIYETKELFVRCPLCRRIYWQGSHVKRMAISDRWKT